MIRLLVLLAALTAGEPIRSGASRALLAPGVNDPRRVCRTAAACDARGFSVSPFGNAARASQLPPSALRAPPRCEAAKLAHGARLDSRRPRRLRGQCGWLPAPEHRVLLRPCADSPALSGGGEQPACTPRNTSELAGVRSSALRGRDAGDVNACGASVRGAVLSALRALYRHHGGSCHSATDKPCNSRAKSRCPAVER